MVEPGTAMQALAVKLIKATAIPWVGMFCMGILAQRNIDRIYPFVAGKFLLFASIYASLGILSHFEPIYPILKGNINSMGIVNYIAMCALVLSIAYSGRGWVRQAVNAQ